MPSATYLERRSQLQTYFDRTAAEAWSRLTSDAPVSRIRATVRAGRDRMRTTLLSWLPDDLRGARLLDAGCGTGALSVEAAQRGADVVAIDVAPTLIALARQRMPENLGSGRIDFRAGDMLDPALGDFDFVVAMDSLIHYRAADCVTALASLSSRTGGAILFTFAPRTPALALMHAAGRLFPRSERAPAIQPVAPKELAARIRNEAALARWPVARTERIVNGFYTSQAMELYRT
ncbi:magnesium protoporphyrin IX methyltransferase [Pseudorhodoplanes sp.]|uniref:magnesium protoporphyrin IX methyltransferase n=1 Tax=Pseudorhodoplanes sp. TaxID=1934341 RepID=UPI00391D85EA